MADVICPECGAPMVLRHTKKFTYKNGDPRAFYGCSRWPECNATHGAHPDGTPLGVPAKKETKKARMATHALMDEYRDLTGISTNKLYELLKNAFGVEIHCGELDAEGCGKVQNKLQGWIEDAK